jgi:tetratricopeptide (TPR) repeat protein
MNVKTPAPSRSATNGFAGLLLGLSLCWLSAGLLYGARQGPPAPLPSPAVQAREGHAKTRPLTLEERADIFMARKSYEDAVTCYYRALRQDNFANAVVWNKLGIAYQQLENFQAARKAYNQSIRHRRDYPEPLNNLGTTYFLQNKYGKSVKYYLKAIKLDPESASYHLNLGTSYYHLKKDQEFFEQYEKALDLNPNIFRERSAFGTVLQARGANSEYYFYLAKIFARKGHTEEAVRNLRRALEDGFKDRKRILNDPDFMKISQNPDYVELMNNPPVAIKD